MKSEKLNRPSTPPPASVSCAPHATTSFLPSRLGRGRLLGFGNPKGAMASLAMPEEAEARARGEEAEPVTPPPQQAEGAQEVGDRRLLRSQYLAVKSLISGRARVPPRNSRHWL